MTLKLFTAEWCGPCQELKDSDVFIEKKHKIDVIDVESDEGQKEANEYSVRSLPSLLVVEDGTIKDHKVGPGKCKEVIKEY